MRAWERAGRGRIIRRWQVGCFGGGLVTIAVALASALDRDADRSLAAHMAQHVLLISVAAPLLAVGAPLVAASYALDVPDAARRVGLRLHRLGGRRRLALLVSVAFVLHATTVGVWHV